MNVIDDTKLQSALTGVSDELTKNVATQVLPVLGAFVDAAVTKLCAEAETVTGATLADLTAERTEALNQLDEMVHGWLDRCANFGILARKQV